MSTGCCCRSEDAGLGLNDVRVVYTPPKYPLTASDYLAVDAWMMWGSACSATPNTPASCGWSPAAKAGSTTISFIFRDGLPRSAWRYHAPPADGADPHRQFIDSHRGEAARLLGRAGDRRPVAEHGPRPPQPSPAADGSVGDPRPADHRRSLLRPRLSPNRSRCAKRCGTVNPRRTSSDR